MASQKRAYPEFGPDGSPVGEFLRISDYTKWPTEEFLVESRRTSAIDIAGNLSYAEDLDALDRVPAYPLTASQLRKYDLKYLGKEQVDEVDCSIFSGRRKLWIRNTAFV